MTDSDPIQDPAVNTQHTNGVDSAERTYPHPATSQQQQRTQSEGGPGHNSNNGNPQDYFAQQASVSSMHETPSDFSSAVDNQDGGDGINNHRHSNSNSNNNFINNTTYTAEPVPPPPVSELASHSTISPLQPVSSLTSALAQNLTLDPTTHLHPASTTTAGAGAGAGAVDVLATENIDPVASYSAWRKKKDTETLQGTQAMMETFLKQHSAYDVLPVSYRQIVMDTTLLVKKALSVLMQYGIVSAPLWDSTKRKFAGMLTATDFINLIQFYYSHSSYSVASREMELFQISQLRDVEKVIGVPPPELFSLHPLQSLYDACHLLVESRAHRLPLVDVDSETGEEMIVSVLTQYRILKFIAMNYQDEKTLRQPLSELKIGIYTDLAVADLSTPVIEVIDMFVKRKISSVPIVDEEGVVLNVYETVDVMTLVKAGVYRDLDLCVAEALLRRPEDFAGVHTCTLNDSLSSIFGTIRKSQVHRLIVVDSENKLKGIVSLSDIMRYLIGGTRDDVVVADHPQEDGDGVDSATATKPDVENSITAERAVDER
ncbi:AMP-activated serine/threonine-protein kinase regulatory subunit [Linnemannia schmuckeri]|uniref:AMP-activated serine/threonine-protein kinase regulatory subunit n=1 Tax=Linnemannia schmuckeri TaxID=64567 RepID=A0A9P5V154_9FUNG|nr:AMP-activated serine/threonine-protein kinase regulatory subunit [Linnemannia schmuckeri]